jgi:hypothetical protein
MCLAQQLDHEAKDVHNVIVLATDKGDQSDTLIGTFSVPNNDYVIYTVLSLHVIFLFLISFKSVFLNFLLLIFRWFEHKYFSSCERE